MQPEAVILDTLASPRRREVLRLVWNEELSAGAIHSAMLDVTFGAVSLQLRILRETGLIAMRRESRQRFYRARRDEFGSIGKMLERMWDDKLWALKLAAELEQTRRGPLPSRRQRRKAHKE